MNTEQRERVSKGLEEVIDRLPVGTHSGPGWIMYDEEDIDKIIKVFEREVPLAGTDAVTVYGVFDHWGDELRAVYRKREDAEDHVSNDGKRKYPPQVLNLELK